MHLVRLEIEDWRNWTRAELEPAPSGLTVIRGANGQGKTNLLEAVAWAGSGKSFRSAPKEALVRYGSESSIVRASAASAVGDVQVDARIPRHGRVVVKLNGQPLKRLGELGNRFPVVVFSPEDLSIVKAGPQQRRSLLDEALSTLHPKHAATISDTEKVLRQRNALIRQASGRWDADAERTLDVWDLRLAELGTELRKARGWLIDEIHPYITGYYKKLSSTSEVLELRYSSSWADDLFAALAEHRKEDRARGVTSVGPHRDDMEISLLGMPARFHASQGEQRSIALATRLAVRDVLWEKLGTPPIVILDDVLSELDQWRAQALGGLVSEGQVILSSASQIPDGMRAETVLTASNGTLQEGDL